MQRKEITLREARPFDVPGLFHVRTSVTENLLTLEQLKGRGITFESVAASFEQDCKGWVAEWRGDIVAFSIADRASHSIFALFVLPGFEGRGLGTHLLDLAVAWLRENGVEVAWLTTDPGTRAAGFYERQGWVRTGREANGEERFQRRLYEVASGG